MMETAFLRLMPDTVSVSTRGGSNSYGEPTWGTARSYRAHVTYVNKVNRDMDGSVTHVTHLIWCNSTRVIPGDAKVVLPNGSTASVLRVDAPHDRFGDVHHCKLTCGWRV